MSVYNVMSEYYCKNNKLSAVFLTLMQHLKVARLNHQARTFSLYEGFIFAMTTTNVWAALATTELWNESLEVYRVFAGKLQRICIYAYNTFMEYAYKYLWPKGTMGHLMQMAY